MGQTDMFEPAALNIGSSSLKAQPTPTANSAGTIMLDCLDDAKSLDTEFLDDLVIEFLKPMVNCPYLPTPSLYSLISKLLLALRGLPDIIEFAT